MNIVALIGNVASEPELRHTSSGKPICTFRLAVARPGSEEADFFTIAAWDRQAEVCAEYLAVGRRVSVEGRLHNAPWESEGSRRRRVEVVANRVQMLGAAKREASTPMEIDVPSID